MEKAKQVFCILCLILFTWIILSTLEIGFHNTDENYQYSKANCFEIILNHAENGTVTVVDCQKEFNYYIVTVEDSKGNLWSYYDYDYKYNGTEIPYYYIKGGN